MNELQRALSADSKVSSHPIIVEVENPDQITSVFDSISYSKVSKIILEEIQQVKILLIFRADLF